MGHSGWTLRFQTPKPRPMTLSAVCLSGCRPLSPSSSTRSAACPHASCSADNELNLQNCKHAPVKGFPLWELPQSWRLFTATEHELRHRRSPQSCTNRFFFTLQLLLLKFYWNSHTNTQLPTLYLVCNIAFISHHRLKEVAEINGLCFPQETLLFKGKRRVLLSISRSFILWPKSI